MSRILQNIISWLVFQFILFLLLVIGIGCSSQEGKMIESWSGLSFQEAELDIFLSQKLEEKVIPGLTIALINEGEVVYHKNFGYANIEQKLPVTNNTMFEGASISKSVFAFFVMKYVEEGKLDLDKPLYQYLPYPDLEHDDRYKLITARMVLSHRTGLPNWREDEEDGQLKLNFDPGTEYGYSGEAYQYLAMALRSIDDTDWNGLEETFQSKIAKPLGMTRTVFVPTISTVQHKAEPYNEMGERIEWEQSYWEVKEAGVFGAGYSIHSEAEDFSKWMIGVMRQEILEKSSFDELFKTHSAVPQEEMDIEYSLGFFKYPFPFRNTVGHGGDNEGFTSYFTLNTQKDWGYVIFTNSEFGQELGEELFFFLIFGPDLTLPYLIAGFSIFLLLIVVSLLIKKIVVKSRKLVAK